MVAIFIMRNRMARAPCAHSLRYFDAMRYRTLGADSKDLALSTAAAVLLTVAVTSGLNQLAKGITRIERIFYSYTGCVPSGRSAVFHWHACHCWCRLIVNNK